MINDFYIDEDAALDAVKRRAMFNVVHKLEWYRAGGEVSERQWGDIIGVLKVQSDALDLDYMRKWATELAVTDLLERALREAGLVTS